MMQGSSRISKDYQGLMDILQGHMRVDTDDVAVV